MIIKRQDSYALRVEFSPIQRLPCFGRSQAVVEEYLAFLSNLVSAQTVYLRPCLKTIISNFIPSKFFVCAYTSHWFTLIGSVTIMFFFALCPERIRIQEGNVDISDSDDEDESGCFFCTINVMCACNNSVCELDFDDVPLWDL